MRGAASIGYFSAGTFEFLLAPDGSFYFLEMNTRLQVEHPITELGTGLDVVREMVRIADGEALGFGHVTRRGAAIEVRLYAEDPGSGFLPSPGKISLLRPASGPFVREDSGVFEGAQVSASYDPLLSKLAVWAEDRGAALARMGRALSDYAVGGIRSNIAFLARVIAHPDFARGVYDIDFVAQKLSELLGQEPAVTARKLGYCSRPQLQSRRTHTPRSRIEKSSRAAASCHRGVERGVVSSNGDAAPCLEQRRRPPSSGFGVVFAALRPSCILRRIPSRRSSASSITTTAAPRTALPSARCHPRFRSRRRHGKQRVAPAIKSRAVSSPPSALVVGGRDRRFALRR